MSVKAISMDQSPVRAPGLSIDAISHLVVAVSDCARAAAFYRDLLGFTHVGSDILPDCSSHEIVSTASGQRVVLAEVKGRPDLRETGVHQAYRVTAADREQIVARLNKAGVEVKRYIEDRPAEERDNFYLFDPDGNRVQLVAAARGGIDHACVQVPDILWAERFWGIELGLVPDHRVGWKTADYVRARLWAEGLEDMAPGTRRMDKRYTVMVNRKTVPRCSMQLFYRAGDAIIGIYLANKHYQAPPEEQITGVPRVAFSASRSTLDLAAEALAAHGRPFAGPIVQPASSPFEAVVSFRDNGGNFFELTTPRRGAAS